MPKRRRVKPLRKLYLTFGDFLMGIVVGLLIWLWLKVLNVVDPVQGELTGLLSALLTVWIGADTYDRVAERREIRKTVSALRIDVETVKGELSSLRSDVNSFREDVGRIEEKLRLR